MTFKIYTLNKNILVLWLFLFIVYFTILFSGFFCNILLLNLLRIYVTCTILLWIYFLYNSYGYFFLCKGSCYFIFLRQCVYPFSFHLSFTCFYLFFITYPSLLLIFIFHTASIIFYSFAQYFIYTLVVDLSLVNHTNDTTRYTFYLLAILLFLSLVSYLLFFSLLSLAFYFFHCST